MQRYGFIFYSIVRGIRNKITRLMYVLFQNLIYLPTKHEFVYILCKYTDTTKNKM